MSGETFDPRQIALTFGVILVEGFADGEAITVERNGDGVTTKTGISGEYAFQEDADQSGIITVRLMSTSPTNKLLLAHLAAGNLPVFVSLTSLSTLEVEVSGKGKLQKAPNKAYSKEVGMREWKIVCGELTSL